MIGGMCIPIFVLSLAQHQAVLPWYHGVAIDGHWLHIHITVVANGLPRTRSIKVPHWELIGILWVAE